jgi:hypothetical protein
MQREKLYNLHRAASFTIVLFAFKIDKILSDQILTLRKRYFLVKDDFVFSYFIFLLPDIFYLKKYITRCSLKSSTIYIGRLVLQL